MVRTDVIEKRIAQNFVYFINTHRHVFAQTGIAISIIKKLWHTCR